MLALSDVSRVGGHADELCYVACRVDAVCEEGDASRSVRTALTNVRPKSDSRLRGDAPYVVTLPRGICPTTP
jgi:hypothetical protein